MVKRKYARNPMLYIQQPDNKSPKASMQHSYRTKKVSTSKSLEGGSVRSRSFFDEEREAREYEESIVFEEELNEDDDPQVHSEDKNARKKFNDRTLEEKIKYFTDAPSYAPKKKCEVKTENKIYRGIIMDRDEEHVFIRLANRSRAVKIMINEIKNIKLLGFS